MTISVNQEKILVDAFKDVVCPKREGLLRSDVVDDSDVVFLYNYVNKSWTDLDSNELSNESSCLTSLSDDGLLFIIPAYLKMYIHGEDDKNGWIDRLLLVIANKGRGKLSLNANQFNVIDEIFLTQVKSDWDKYQGSCFGDNLSKLVDIARKRWRNVSHPRRCRTRSKDRP